MLDLADIADVVADAVREATTPLLARIDALEKRELLLPEKGDPGEPGPQGEQGPAGEVDMAAVKALIDQAVAALPPAEKGEPGEPGRDVDMDDVGSRIEMAVKSAVAALPAPKDGEPGKDGVGLADALIDKDGHLVVTMTDGRTKALGVVVGSDGERGPAGFSLEHFNIEGVSERTVRFSFRDCNEEVAADITIPSLVGKGIWSAEGDYERGDVTTWGGTAWEAVEPEKGVKPDASSGGWRILAKRGRDGKDAGK